MSVAKRLNKSKVAGKTITLKIKYSDFTLQTRSKTLQYYISDKSVILDKDTKFPKAKDVLSKNSALKSLIS